MGFQKQFFINIFFLFFTSINLFINCIKQNIENFNDLTGDKFYNGFTFYPLFLNDILANNALMNSGFDPEIRNKTINLGSVQTELIYKETIYIFNFEQNDIKNESEESNYLIHFYPLDCHIKIAVANNKSIINTNIISNYDYDAFSVLIPKNESKSVKIKLKTLITSNDEYMKNRTCHLIINSFQNNESPELNIADNKPILLYFNGNLKNVNLLYDLNNSLETKSIFVSFFVKEMVKFDVEVENCGIHKTISHKDNFIIPRENISDIKIKINKYEDEEEKEAVLIVRIEEDYTIPRYLQKNILNLEFIEVKLSYQYFYMEIFKGEEGQIYLNNKKFEGFLIGKIIEKGKITEEEIISNSNIFPDINNEYSFSLDDDFLEYYKYEMKLSFISYQTEKCEMGCYLLITYFSKTLYSQNMRFIKGGEYSLYARIWDKEEYSPQIINIPLNEYIFGTFDLSSVNVHYYSVFIPDDTKNIIFEMENNFLYENILVCSKKGIVKINAFGITDVLEINNIINEKNKSFDKILINLNCKDFGFDSFEKKYISFIFKTIDLFAFSSYYFRISRKNPNENLMINILDINKPNLCQTTKFNESDTKYSCFFLINNQYREITNEFAVYGYGQKKVQYFYWLIYENDYNSIDFNNVINSENNSSDKIYLIVNTTNVDKPNFVLIKLESLFQEELTVITNYYTKLPNTFFIQIYSYKIYTIKENNNLFFEFELEFASYDKLRLIIDNSDGNGVICLDHYCNEKDTNKTKIKISQNNIVSFIITKDIKLIDIKASKFLVFNIKMDYIIDDSILKELSFNLDFNGRENIPAGYYLKQVEFNGVDINIHFKFNDNNNLFDQGIIIDGYFVDYDVIKIITSRDQFDFSNSEKIFFGKYDKRTNNGLIIFDKESTENDFLERDKYYLIFIFNEEYRDLDRYLEINSISKNSPQTRLPINQYISGCFDLKANKTQSQRYYFKDFYKTENITIEFSSNYNNIKLIFNNNTIKYKDTKTVGGKEIYYITIPYQDNNKIELNEAYFEVVANDDIDEENIFNIKEANYIIKYYIDSLDNQQNKYNYDLSHSLKEIDRKGNNCSYSLIITNKESNDEFKEGYEFFYHLDVYEKNKIHNGESLNTIASTESRSIFYAYNFSNCSLDKIEYKLNNLKMNEIYVVSLFINIQESEMSKETKEYYVYTFEIKLEEKKKNNKLLIYLSVVFTIFIIIVLIAFFMLCRHFKRKNKNLKEKVQALSFSSGIKEDAITENKSKEDEDYETTFI